MGRGKLPNLELIMKTKSALFLSAMLTAFVLAILASLVSAFNSDKTTNLAVVASPTQQVALAVLPTQPEATAALPTQVGAEQAASIAAQYMNKTDVYSVETSSINGANAYKVVFSSGDIVFVGLDGKVISTSKLPPVTVNVVPPAAPKQHHSGNKGHASGGGEGEGGDN